MSFPKPRFHRIAAAIAGLAIVLATAAAVAADDGGASPDAQPSKNAHAPILDLRRQQPVGGDAQAGKALSAVCSACHGGDGIGIAPNFPNLAGQSATYLYVQLKTFRDGHRVDPIMAPMVASLGEADMRNLAAYFASLPARPGASPAQASRGNRLFSEGDPSRGIPPCEGCHGPGGKGPPPDADIDAVAPHLPWSTIPRLHGQSGVYVAKALHDFRSGARAGTSNAAIMNGVAQSLDEADIQSLADSIPGQ